MEVKITSPHKLKWPLVWGHKEIKLKVIGSKTLNEVTQKEGVNATTSAFTFLDKNKINARF